LALYFIILSSSIVPYLIL